MEPKPLKWTYELATSLFVCGGPYDPPCDPATQAIERYDRNPDPRTERWDGTVASKKRLATPAEIDAYDAARVDERAAGEFDNAKAIKAALLVMRAYCNALKAGTYTTKAVADVRADFMTAWKALP